MPFDVAGSWIGGGVVVVDDGDTVAETVDYGVAVVVAAGASTIVDFWEKTPTVCFQLFCNLQSHDFQKIQLVLCLMK